LKFGNPLVPGTYGSCLMEGEDSGRMFAFGDKNGIVFSFSKT